MSFLEEIGWAVINFSRKVLYYSIGALIKCLKLSRRIKIYPYFERRGTDFVDYLILLTQVFALAFLIFAVVYIFGFLGLWKFLILAALSGGYSLYTIYYRLRLHLKDDFTAYRDFFLSYLAIPGILVLFDTATPANLFKIPNLHLVVVSFILILLFSLLFRKRHAREYTFGRVIQAGALLRVKVNYDIRADVRPGIVTVENKLGAEKEDIVKLRVAKHFFNLRGGSIIGLEEVVGKI